MALTLSDTCISLPLSSTPQKEVFVSTTPSKSSRPKFVLSVLLFRSQLRKSGHIIIRHQNSHHHHQSRSGKSYDHHITSNSPRAFPSLAPRKRPKNTSLLTQAPSSFPIAPAAAPCPPFKLRHTHPCPPPNLTSPRLATHNKPKIPMLAAQRNPGTSLPGTCIRP
ncbi:hypothetical protein K402DRAFT_401974 [Aulographum hederae CBS 113979]|uniref:Uncharacterized protein n=1 Tax=Aulographum hederae CBS 113979 TaxID=1176131 RepID=A0A6G1H8N3_9PEZI|nr:hypothetical protein K402DRAFT_401974 [Aulographum hederae CBS 113979]